MNGKKTFCFLIILICVLFLDSKFFERRQVFEFSEVLSSLEWHRGACGGSQGNKPFRSEERRVGKECRL